MSEGKFLFISGGLVAAMLLAGYLMVKISAYI